MTVDAVDLFAADGMEVEDVEIDAMDDADADAEASVDLDGRSDGDDEDDGSGSEDSDDRAFIDHAEDEEEDDDADAHYRANQQLDLEAALREAAKAAKAPKPKPSQRDREYARGARARQQVGFDQEAAAEAVHQREFGSDNDADANEVKHAKPARDKDNDRFWYRSGEIPLDRKDEPPGRKDDPYFTFEEMADLTTLQYGLDPDAEVPTMAPFLLNVGRCPWATYLKQLDRFGLEDEFSRHYRLPFLAPSDPEYQAHVKYLAGRLTRLIVTPEKAQRVLTGHEHQTMAILFV